MFGFVVGVALGVAAKIAYDRLQGQELPADAPEYQRRAAALLDETRQLLGEIRQEVSSATESARERAGTRLERLRSIASSSEVEPPTLRGESASPPGSGNGARGTPETGPGTTSGGGGEQSAASGSSRAASGEPGAGRTGASESPGGASPTGSMTPSGEPPVAGSPPSGGSEPAAGGSASGAPPHGAGEPKTTAPKPGAEPRSSGGGTTPSSQSTP